MVRKFTLAIAVMALGLAGCKQETAPVAENAPGTGSRAATGAATQAAPAQVPAQTVLATISGGHETDPRDRGRPDILVAAGLGVPTEVFREAFSHVKPAPAGQQPDPQQVQANKRALMDALGKYGVTNERLDEVSNAYRYPPGDPGLWKHTEAVVKATVVDGKVTGFVVESAGAGYTSVPAVTVPGFPNLSARVTLYFGKQLEKNGSVEKVEVGQ